MKSLFFWIGCLILIFLWVRCTTQEKELSIVIDQRDTLVFLENDTLSVTFSLMGGMLINMHEKSSAFNPFYFDEGGLLQSPHNPMIQKGHYVCLGRWGNLTPGEARQGMPEDGEICNNLWKMNSPRNPRNVKMSCEAPLDGILATREITLSSVDPLVKIRESYANELTIGRPISIVQCTNFTLPFLDSTFRIFSNATFGYIQKKGLSNVRIENKWPNAMIDSTQDPVDLSKNSYPFDFTSSHIIQDTLGWVTVENAKAQTMIGFVWNSSDYPWLNITQTTRYGKIWLKKISFGTTGLTDSLPVVQRLTTIFHGVKNFEFLDAKDIIYKSYFCFFLHLPSGYKKIISINQYADTIIVKVLVSGKIKEIRLSI